MARLARNDELVQRSRGLAWSLARAGVGGGRPSRAELARDQIGRNDSADRFVVEHALLTFDLALPTEDPGKKALVRPDRDEVWVCQLFERAILGFARIELEPLAWSVRGSVPLRWQVSSATESLRTILPRMITDIVLDPPNRGRRLVVDTKFASILTAGRFGDDRLKSAYLYQMYAYLRSQEGLDSQWDGAAGLFLHPSVGDAVYERAVIQNHPITFATVDLGGRPVAIRTALRKILYEQTQIE